MGVVRVARLRQSGGEGVSPLIVSSTRHRAGLLAIMLALVLSGCQLEAAPGPDDLPRSPPVSGLTPRPTRPRTTRRPRIRRAGRSRWPSPATSTSRAGRAASSTVRAPPSARCPPLCAPPTWRWSTWRAPSPRVGPARRRSWRTPRAATGSAARHRPSRSSSGPASMPSRWPTTTPPTSGRAGYATPSGPTGAARSA